MGLIKLRGGSGRTPFAKLRGDLVKAPAGFTVVTLENGSDPWLWLANLEIIWA